jgi:hypothetical protein
MYLWSEFRIRVDLRYECTQPRPKKEKHITDSSMHWTGEKPPHGVTLQSDSKTEPWKQMYLWKVLNKITLKNNPNTFSVWEKISS